MATLETSPAVLDLLQRGTITGELFVLPPGNLERPLYQAVNAALNSAGGVWSKKQKGHLFPPGTNVAEKLGVIVESKEFTKAIDPIKAKRDALQSFYTPPELAKRVVEMAQIEAGHVVLEPSAGDGAIVQAVLDSGADFGALTAVEINPDMEEKLVERVKAAGDDATIYIADFLTLKLPREFDRVVMNPPFSKNQDIKHVQHALSLLAPGGIVVAIMSPMAPRKDAFLRMVEGYLWETEDVPAGTFEETDIATVLVKIRRP